MIELPSKLFMKPPHAPGEDVNSLFRPHRLSRGLYTCGDKETTYTQEPKLVHLYSREI
jgi:hypothetical protein